MSNIPRKNSGLSPIHIPLNQPYVRYIKIKDPIENIRNTNSVEMVMKNGRLYDGNNLDQIYPLKQKAKNFDWQEDYPSSLPGVKN